MSQQRSAAGGATTDSAQEKSPREPWYPDHPPRHAHLYFLATAVAGFLIWWIVAEAITPDGTKVWWTWWWTVVLVALVPLALAAQVGGWKGARFYRKSKSNRTGDEDDTLFWLVAGGILTSVALASAMGYAQAELLTGPGESVGALEHGELLDIARATTFALAALGAVAVLLVNYRKQRAVEAALKHDQIKHRDDLEREDRKQQASERAALHERYTKAVEQLANKDNAAIRLGGVHALAALGDDWAAQKVPSQRQVCVDLLCSYLRDAPRDESTEERDQVGTLVDWEWDTEFLKQDRNVRKAALEWLSRLATADAQQSDPGDGDKPTATVDIDLRGIVLEGMDLSYAKLAHLKMPKAQLKSVNLSEARLEHADLTGAFLRYARLENTVLNDATLVGAQMYPVGAAKAHFVAADLTGADLECADLKNADFTSANLTSADLTDARVDRCTSFTSATLDDANFSGVDVRRLDLAGVDYSTAKNFDLHPEKNSDEPQEGPSTSGDDDQTDSEGSAPS